ncbi:nestin [Pseudophryne corroboree]|uniref:nestin n=1 Tax=Pseudophryne corroboree TaxID=495146 RepID=UPI003081EC85
METYRASVSSLDEESSQMWRLNKRLESYLSRVKSLEEENEMLRAEIHRLKDTRSESSLVRKYHEEIMKLRDALDDSHQEMIQVEMAKDDIHQEIQHVKELCLQEQQARQDVKKELLESQKTLEEEQRAQTWLKDRLVQLQEELEDILNTHEEEKALMEEEISSYSQRLGNVRLAPVAFQPVNVEDYASKLSQIWQGAVEEYKNEVSALETSLSESHENLRKVVDENKKSQLHLQNLDRELQTLKERKDMLEELVSQQWLDQQEEEGKLQLEIEALEKEKQDLRVQIAQVLEDRQQLMHLKMSLSLEVATYRSLLEAESTRIYSPSVDYKVSSAFNDSVLERKELRKRQAENRDYRLYGSKQSAETSTPNRYLNVKNTSFSSRASPVTKEFQKVSSVLQSQSLKYAKASSAKAATPLPTVESNLESCASTGDVFRKSKVETISHSCTRDSSKAVTEETVKNDTKDYTVPNRNINHTIDTKLKETEFLGGVESTQYTTDLLESSLKTIEKHNQVIYDFVAEGQQNSLQVQNKDHDTQFNETPHKDKSRLDVPQTVIDSPCEGFESVLAGHFNEKHETLREIDVCQKGYFEKQEIVELTINGNIEGPGEVQNFKEPITTNADDSLASSQIKEQEKTSSVETEEPKLFPSDCVSDHGLASCKDDVNDTASFDTEHIVGSLSNSKETINLWPNNEEPLQINDDDVDISVAEQNTYLLKQVETESDLQEEVTLCQHFSGLSALKETSNQLFDNAEDIIRESQDQQKLRDTQQKIEHAEADTEDVNLELSDLENVRQPSTKDEDISDGLQSFDIKHAVDQWTDGKQETPQLDKCFELSDAEHPTDNLKPEEDEAQLSEEVTIYQEVHCLSVEKEDNQFIDKENQKAEDDHELNNEDQVDAILKHVESEKHLLEEEVTVGQQCHLLGAQQDSSQLPDIEMHIQTEDQEDQKNFELNSKEQESRVPEEEQERDNISDTERINHESSEKSNQANDDQEIVNQLNGVYQENNQVSENFKNIQTASQEEQANEFNGLEKNTQVSDAQQGNDIIIITEEITKVFNVNDQAMQYYGNEEDIVQLKDIQQENNQRSEKVEGTQHSSKKDLENVALANTEESRNINGNGGNAIEEDQEIQTLDVTDIANLSSAIKQDIYQLSENFPDNQDLTEEEEKCSKQRDSELDNISLAEEQESQLPGDKIMSHMIDDAEVSGEELINEDTNAPSLDEKQDEKQEVIFNKNTISDKGEDRLQANHELQNEIDLIDAEHQSVELISDLCSKMPEGEHRSLDVTEAEGDKQLEGDDQVPLPFGNTEETYITAQSFHKEQCVHQLGNLEEDSRQLLGEEDNKGLIDQDSSQSQAGEEISKENNEVVSTVDSLIEYSKSIDNEVIIQSSQSTLESDAEQPEGESTPTSKVEESQFTENDVEGNLIGSDTEQYVAEDDRSLLTITESESQLLGHEADERLIRSDGTENDSQLNEPETIIQYDSEACTDRNTEEELESHNVHNADQVAEVVNDHLRDTEVTASDLQESEDLSQTGGEEKDQVVLITEENSVPEDNEVIKQSVGNDSDESTQTHAAQDSQSPENETEVELVSHIVEVPEPVTNNEHLGDTETKISSQPEKDKHLNQLGGETEIIQERFEIVKEATPSVQKDYDIEQCIAKDDKSLLASTESQSQLLGHEAEESLIRSDNTETDSQPEPIIQDDSEVCIDRNTEEELESRNVDNTDQVAEVVNEHLRDTEATVSFLHESEDLSQRGGEKEEEDQVVLTTEEYSASEENEVINQLGGNYSDVVEDNESTQIHAAQDNQLAENETEVEPDRQTFKDPEPIVCDTEPKICSQQENENEQLNQLGGETEIIEESFEVVEEAKQSFQKDYDIEQCVAEEDRSLLTSTESQSQLLGHEAEATVSFLQESEDLSQIDEEKEEKEQVALTKEEYSASENEVIKQSVQNDSDVVEDNEAAETHAAQDSQSPENETEVEPYGHNVDVREPLPNNDHLSDTEAKISSQQETEDEHLNQLGEEKEPSQESSKTAKEAKQSLQKDYDIEQCVSEEELLTSIESQGQLLGHEAEESLIRSDNKETDSQLNESEPIIHDDSEAHTDSNTEELEANNVDNADNMSKLDNDHLRDTEATVSFLLESKDVSQTGGEKEQEDQVVLTTEEYSAPVYTEVIQQSVGNYSDVVEDNESTQIYAAQDIQLPENETEVDLVSHNVENPEPVPENEHLGDTIRNTEDELEANNVDNIDQVPKVVNNHLRDTVAAVSFPQESYDLSQTGGEKVQGDQVMLTTEENSASEENEVIKQLVGNDSERVEDNESTQTNVAQDSQLPENETEVELVSHHLEDHEPVPDNTYHSATEAKISSLQEKENVPLNQSCVETELSQENYEIVEEAKQSVQNDSLVEDNESTETHAIQDSQLPENETEVEPYSYNVNVCEPVSDNDHHSDTETKISSQQDKEDNQSDRGKGDGEEISEALFTAKEYTVSNEKDEINQTVRKESGVENNSMVLLSIIQNNLRFASDIDGETELTPQQHSDELCEEKAELSENSNLDNCDNKHNNIIVEETISEDKILEEKERKLEDIDTENAKNEKIHQNFPAEQQEPANVDKVYQIKDVDYENNEERVEESIVQIGTSANSQELSHEIPPGILDVLSPTGHQEEIEDIQAVSNLTDQPSISDESLCSQDISVCSEKSEDFEISKDYQLEQTLPDTTPLPNLDDEFDELADNDIIPASGQPEDVADPHVPEYRAENEQDDQVLDSSLESQTSQLATGENEQSSVSKEDEVCNIELEYKEQEAEIPKVQLEKEDADKFEKQKQEPDFLAGNSSEALDDDTSALKQEKQHEDLAVSTLENENSESEESMNSQEEVSMYSLQNEFKDSKDNQSEQTLLDTIPSSDLTEKLEKLAENQLQLTSQFEHCLTVDEAANEKTCLTEDTELVYPPEHRETELHADADITPVAEDTTVALNQDINFSGGNADSAEKDSLIKNQTDLQQETELDSDTNRIEHSNKVHIEDSHQNESKEGDLEFTDVRMEKETAIDPFHEVKDYNIRPGVHITLSEQSEIQYKISVDNPQGNVEVENIISESEGSSDDISPNVTTVRDVPEPEDEIDKITEEDYNGGKVEQIFEDTYGGETSSTPELVPSSSPSEPPTSDDDKDTTGESSDSSLDSYSAFERGAFQEGKAVSECTAAHQIDTNTVNGLHKHTIVQATLDLEDHLFNGHSKKQHSEIVISERKTIVTWEGDTANEHAQDILENPEIKFAMSKGKIEGIFQSVPETPDHGEPSRLDEGIEIKKEAYAAVEYDEPAANKMNYTKKAINPYLSDNEFSDQSQIKSSLVVEDIMIDTNKNQEASETLLCLNQEKEDLWSSDN